MSLLPRARSLVRNLLRRGRVERALDEELQAYLDLLTEEKMAAGLSRESARRAARVALGGAEQVKERVREVRAGAWLAQAAQDLRYAGRVMRRSPSFTVVAVTTLALGIGANTAMFSTVDTVLIRPLPYRDPAGIVSISGMGYLGELLELRARARTFDVAAHLPERPVTLTGSGDPVRLSASSISVELPRLLGVAPLVGRALDAEDERPGAPRVALISAAAWRDRFGSSPGVLGSAITIDGVDRTVVGVMPPAFQFPSTTTEVWLPMLVDRANRVALWSTGGRLVGRIRPGQSLAAVRAELRDLGPAMRRHFPWNMPAEYGQAATAVPLRDALLGNLEVLLSILLGSVGMVLLIACVNVSNLFVARSIGRSHELAIRAAIGAGRARILRQVLTEGAAIGALGGVCGVGLAALLVRTTTGLLPAGLPGAADIAIDGRVLLFTAVVAVGCGLLVGALPAVTAARADAAPVLRGGTRSGPPRAAAIASRVLVGLQLAIAVPLVIAAVLLGRSFWNLTRVSPGFEPAQLVMARVTPPPFRYRDAPSRVEFYRRLHEKLSAIPGLDGVALADRSPFGAERFGSVFTIARRPDPAREGGEWPLADVRATIGVGYLGMLRVPLVDGRDFAESDGAEAPGVVLVSRALAAKYWPGESPVGREIKFPGDARWRTVIGVTADVKWQAMTEEVQSTLYVPLAQLAPASVTILLRTGDLRRAAADVRAAVASLDRDTPVDAIETMQQRVDRSMQPAWIATLLIGSFAALGLGLGALGVYGAVSDLVARRRREIAVRIALGAGFRDVIRDVALRALVPAAIGIASGLAAAAFTSRLLSALLFGVRSGDATSFVLVPLALAAVAVVASVVPARRASRIDPLSSLRAE